jgi:Txe/YoeB family toxin of toxin-antitoxin system
MRVFSSWQRLSYHLFASQEDVNIFMKYYKVVSVLVEATTIDPFTGIGKPESLKYRESNNWSRRITQEHRLVNRVTKDRIDFLQARYHY